MATTAIALSSKKLAQQKTVKALPRNMRISSRKELLSYVKSGNKLNSKNRERYTSAEARKLLGV